jgi:hypothetical protein
MSADMLEKSMRQLCFAGHNARFLTGMPMTLLVATGVVQICEAVVDVDESTWNAPARRAGVCHNSVILDFCVAREGDPSPLFRFEKSPRGHFTALFECFVAS